MRASFSAVVLSAVHAACLLWPSDAGSKWKPGIVFAQAISSPPDEGLGKELLELPLEGQEASEVADWMDDQTFHVMHRKLLHGCHTPRCMPACPRCRMVRGSARNGHCKAKGLMHSCRPPNTNSGRDNGAEGNEGDEGDEGDEGSEGYKGDPPNQGGKGSDGRVGDEDQSDDVSDGGAKDSGAGRDADSEDDARSGRPGVRRMAAPRSRESNEPAATAAAPAPRGLSRAMSRGTPSGASEGSEDAGRGRQ